MKLLILLFLFACAHKPSEHVGHFIHELKTDYEIKDDLLLAEYQKYLEGVDLIFHNHKLDEKFPEYITSVKNSFQIHAHTDFLLQGRYRKERAGRPHFIDYKTYRKNILTEIRQKLDAERLEKLKENHDPALISELKTLHDQHPNLHAEFPL